MTKELTIDPELRDYLPKLTADEKARLRETLLEDGGAIDPIITWANHEDTIIDGHNRYEICTELDLPFRTKAMKFENRSDVLAWIIKHQDGRRNWTDAQRRLALGKLYQEKKKEDAGRPKTSEKQGSNNGPTVGPLSPNGRTSEVLAAEQGVSKNTVNRAATFATDVESLPEETRDAIVTESVKSTPKAVHELAKLPPKKRDKASKLIASGKVESVKEAVSKATGEKPKPIATPRSAHVKKGIQALGMLVRALSALKVLEMHRTDLDKVDARLKGIK
jgi:mRNA-degrading endonuclease RelE of RelBE toxin-antitoxin system